MTPQELAARLRCPRAPTPRLSVSRCRSPMAVSSAGASRPWHCGPVMPCWKIGPGDAAFAGDITGAADGIRYTGLDWSADMVVAARAHNPALLAAGQANSCRAAPRTCRCRTRSSTRC